MEIAILIHSELSSPITIFVDTSFTFILSIYRTLPKASGFRQLITQHTPSNRNLYTALHNRSKPVCWMNNS